MRELLQNVAEATGAFEVLHGQPLAWSHVNSRLAPEDVDWPGFVELMSEWRGKDVFVTLETLIRFDHERMAESLGEALPGATILVTTRSPEGYLRSSYSHAIRKGRNYEPDQFGVRYTRNSMAKTHDFASIQKAYTKVFGPGSVRFLPFELVRDDLATYLGEIARLCGLSTEALFAGIPENRNVGAPEFFLALVKHANMRLWETDAEFADSKEWKAFLRMSADSLSEAKELWPVFERMTRPLGVSYEAPDVPEKLRKRFARMQAPLRELPIYQPYLKQYGLI